MRMNEPSEQGARLEVDEFQTIALTTISSDIFLRTYEAADPEMTAALSMIGRAADVLGRLEDAIIFNGQPGRGEGPSRPVAPPIYEVKGGEWRPGLLTIDEASQSFDDAPDEGAPRWENPIGVDGASDQARGASLVTSTVHAISMLEGQGHYGPFALVLGTTLYLAANTPNENSMVLPSDRIVPFLDGPLLRSSTIPADQGVLIALAGDPIDLVVAHDLELKFIQMTVEPRYVLRLSERFTLRIKQERATCVLEATHQDGQ
jgi:hypothetical protein